jgi:hypothetical protein
LDQFAFCNNWLLDASSLQWLVLQILHVARGGLARTHAADAGISNHGTQRRSQLRNSPQFMVKQKMSAERAASSLSMRSLDQISLGFAIVAI